MRNSILFALFFLSCMGINRVCQAHEILDVETLPSLRTKQYSAGIYKKIIIISAPRTGSSLLYNTFRFLFEYDSKIFSPHTSFDENRLVLKTHRYTDLNLTEKKENVLYIFAIRNPFNAIKSHYKISPRKITNIRLFVEDLIKKHQKYLILSETMKEKGQNVIVLRYEEFADNMDDLFKTIEKLFLICIDPRDKGLIKKGYSKQNISSCTEHFAGFKEYLPISGFHGKHISLDHENTLPEQLIFWLNFCLKNDPLFSNYGYFFDS